MATTESKSLGRPLGAKNIETVVHVVTPACPECGSHNRTKYEGGTPQLIKGVLLDGRRYNRAIRRRTSCIDCGKPRIDEWIEISSE